MEISIPSMEKYFKLFVTHVAGEGQNLKICGQINRQMVSRVETMLECTRESFKKGVGVVLPHMIAVGMFCILEYKDGLYYRVKLINADFLSQGIVSVYFLDYGKTDIVAVASLRSLDNYDSILTALPPQADQFYLHQVMNPSKWEESYIMKLQTQLCFAEYPAMLTGKSETLPVIAIQFKGSDLSLFIIKCLGLPLPIPPEAYVTNISEDHSGNWHTAGHFYKQVYPVKPATAVNLYQNLRPPTAAISDYNNLPQQPPNVPASSWSLKQPSTSARVTTRSVAPRLTVKTHPSTQQSKNFQSRLLDVNGTYNVFIPYADEGPELFAVQLVEESGQLGSLMDAINSEVLQTLNKPPMIGTICLGRMTVDRMVCRAIVISVTGSQCKLYFVDFGDTETISYHDIYEIPEKFVTPNIFAIKFCLSQVKKLPKGPETIEAFKLLVEDNIIKLKVVPPEGPPLIQYAELYTGEGNVLDLLLAAVRPPLFKEMPMIPVGDSRQALVSYVDNCAKFFIQLSSLTSELTEVMDAVKVHCEANTPLEKVTLGLACCARFPVDGEWYRARIVAIAGDCITVSYVDYGNEHNVSIWEIRSITPGLTELPAMALKCALKEFEHKENDVIVANQLEMLVLERTFTVNVIGVHNDTTMLVTMTDDSVNPNFDVIKEMHKLSSPRNESQKQQDNYLSTGRQTLTSPPPETSHAAGDKSHGQYGHSTSAANIPPYNNGVRQQYGERSGPRPLQRRDNPDGAERSRPPPPPHDGSRRSQFKKHTKNDDEFQNREHDNKFRNRAPRESRGGKYNSGSRDHRDKRDYNDNDVFERKGRENQELYDSNKQEGHGASEPMLKRRGLTTQLTYRKLPEPVPLNTSFLDPEIELGAELDVSVTWMVFPDSFIVQILTHEIRFQEMMDTIPDMYKGVLPLTDLVTKGDAVVARFPEDGVLYRATVFEVCADNQFVVQYVDFGNKCKVNARDLWPLDRSLLEIPRLGVNCGLAGVVAPEGKWQNGADVDACFNAPRYKCVFMEQDNGRYKVAMYNNGESVADVLLARGLAEAAPGPLEEVTLKDEPIEPTLLPGQLLAVRVSHVEGLDKFFVQLEPDKVPLVEAAIDTLDPSLLQPLPEEYLTAGYHCTARVDGRVYRCIVLEVVDSSNVHLVLPDYGRTVTAPADQIMVLPLPLSVYFYQAQHCAMGQDQNVSEQQLQELQGKDCVVQVEALDGARLLVRLLEPPSPAGSLLPCPVLRTNFGIAYLSHAASLSSLFLQRDSDAGRIAALLDELYQFYEEGPDGAALAEPAVDTVCAAKSADGNWYRGRVVALRDNACEVHYPDYGNDELIPAENLRRLEPRFLTTAALALPVSLGLETAGEGALAALRQWCGELQLQVSLSSRLADGRWLASLHLDGVDLAARLVGEELATPLPTEGRIQVYVSHVDSPGQFWLQMPAEVDRIEEIQAELQKDAAAYPALEDREVGAVCAALYSADEQWYRAVLLDADADILTVRFIDYGNTDVLDNAPGALRLLPQNLRDEAPLAVRASLDAVPPGPEWSEEATAAFKRLLGDLEQPLEGVVVLAEPSVTYLDLFAQGANVGAALVAEGLASVAPRPGGELPACFTSHINSPAEFWLQLDNANFDAIDAALAPGEALPLLDEAELSEGCLCAAKFHEDDRWYRAQVVACGSAGTEVLFLDYGNSSISQELRRLPQELVSLPPLARKCALQRPRDVATWPRAAERHFVTVTAEGATVLRAHFVASGDVSIVELFYGEPQRSLTEELVALCEDASVQPEIAVSHSGDPATAESDELKGTILENYSETLVVDSSESDELKGTILENYSETLVVDSSESDNTPSTTAESIIVIDLTVETDATDENDSNFEEGSPSCVNELICPEVEGDKSATNAINEPVTHEGQMNGFPGLSEQTPARLSQNFELFVDASEDTSFACNGDDSPEHLNNTSEFVDANDSLNSTPPSFLNEGSPKSVVCDNEGNDDPLDCADVKASGDNNPM